VEEGEPLILLNQSDKVEEVPVPSGSVIFGLPGSSTAGAPRTFNGATLALIFLDDYIRIASYRFNEDYTRNAKIHFHTSFPLPIQGRYILDSLVSCASCPEFKTVSYCLLHALLNMVYELIKRTPQGRTGKSMFTWNRIETYLKSHISDDLSRNNVAKVFQMNSSYVSELCQKHTNFSFNEVVNNIRISHALPLLSLDLTLDEIALLCGFKNTGYFIRRFKRIAGVSPGKYRMGRFQ
jgi:AraC-like DNA-binding protein